MIFQSRKYYFLVSHKKLHRERVRKRSFMIISFSLFCKNFFCPFTELAANVHWDRDIVIINFYGRTKTKSTTFSDFSYYCYELGFSKTSVLVTITFVKTLEQIWTISKIEFWVQTLLKLFYSNSKLRFGFFLFFELENLSFVRKLFSYFFGSLLITKKYWFGAIFWLAKMWP